jgi:hypothetical protein
MPKRNQKRRLRKARVWANRFTKTVREYGTGGRPKSHPTPKGETMPDNMIACPRCDRVVNKKGLAKHTVAIHVKGFRCETEGCRLAAVAMMPDGSVRCSQCEDAAK